MSTISSGTTATTALVSTGDLTGTLQLLVNTTTPAVTLNTVGAIGVGSTPGYGTSGQLLTSSGSGAAPTWATPSASIYTTGSLVFAGTQGFTYPFGGGGVYIMQNPSTVGATLKLAGIPSQDLTYTTGLSASRASYLTSSFGVKRDFYNNQLITKFQGTLDIGSSNATLSGIARAKDGDDWTTIAAGTSTSATVAWDVAVNPYTGQNVVVRLGINNGTIYTNGPSNLYNVTGATNTTTINTVIGGGTASTIASFINFLDLGSQALSKFFIGAFDLSNLQYRVLTSADGITWTSNLGYSGNRQWSAANFAGNATEIMCGSANGSAYGVIRSLDRGTTWDSYNFGDATNGTSASYYQKSLTHNGTYWLCVESNNNYVASKLMGSGTVWTYVTNIPSTFGVCSSVTYNSADSKWYALLANGSYSYLYANSSSDPSGGTWTLVQPPINISAGGFSSVSTVMALSSQALNPYMWTTGSY